MGHPHHQQGVYESLKSLLAVSTPLQKHPSLFENSMENCWFPTKLKQLKSKKIQPNGTSREKPSLGITESGLIKIPTSTMRLATQPIEALLGQLDQLLAAVWAVWRLPRLWLC